MSPSVPPTRPTTSKARPSRRPRECQTFTLASGHILGFTEYGSRRGTPVFYFHGFPSTRLEGSEWHFTAKHVDVRIISVDRPGIGLSSFQPDRKLVDWPSDIRQLARHLNLQRYYVLGSSGGGPYALACAKMLPSNELCGVGVLAGMGPWKAGTKGMRWMARIAWNVMAWAPLAIRLHMEWVTVPAAHNPDPDVLQKMLEGPAPLGDDDDSSKWSDMMRECLKQGAQGYMAEGRIFTTPWGFELEDVLFDSVRLWYGTDDTQTPIGVGRYMAKYLPNSVLKEYPGLTHFSISDRSEEILMDLVTSQ